MKHLKELFKTFHVIFLSIVVVVTVKLFGENSELFGLSSKVLSIFAYNPLNPLDNFFLPIFLCAFVVQDFWHFAGNLFIALIFGLPVERRIGRIKSMFLAFGVHVFTLLIVTIEFSVTEINQRYYFFGPSLAILGVFSFELIQRWRLMGPIYIVLLAGFLSMQFSHSQFYDPHIYALLLGSIAGYFWPSTRQENVIDAIDQ